MSFAVLGKQSIASDFGKKGTSSDITLYDKKESDIIKTWAIPNGFPDKIQPLFQVINFADYPIFHVDSLDKFTGEQIIALDILGKKQGILSHTYDVDQNKLDSMIKGTILEQYTKVESDKIKQTLDTFKPISTPGDIKIVVDHCFDVKGVGTVVLAKILSGSLKQYDTLKLLPSNIDVVVKSIQMHGDSVDKADSGAHVGLSLKGVKPDQVTRGDLLCHDALISSDITIDFQKNPFYKGNPSENQMCLVSIGLQIKSAKFSSIDPVRLVLDKPAICTPSDTCVILKPESSSIRILGSGCIL